MRRAGVLGLAVCLCLSVALQRKPLERWYLEAVAPLERALQAPARAWRALEELRRLRRENARLRAEVQRLRLQTWGLRLDLRQAERLWRLLSLSRRLPMRTLAAPVVGRSPTAAFHTLLIGRGTAQGVRPGMGVICPEGVVGRVVAAAPHQAKVQLLTDPLFAVEVVLERSGARALLVGRSNACLAKYLRDTDPVRIGEMVLTAGDAGFPRGIPVGQVEEVRPRGCCKVARVRPTVRPGALQEVLVVLRP